MTDRGRQGPAVGTECRATLVETGQFGAARQFGIGQCANRFPVNRQNRLHKSRRLLPQNPHARKARQVGYRVRVGIEHGSQRRQLLIDRDQAACQPIAFVAFDGQLIETTVAGGHMLFSGGRIQLTQQHECRVEAGLILREGLGQLARGHTIPDPEPGMGVGASVSPRAAPCQPSRSERSTALTSAIGATAFCIDASSSRRDT